MHTRSSSSSSPCVDRASTPVTDLSTPATGFTLRGPSEMPYADASCNIHPVTNSGKPENRAHHSNPLSSLLTTTVPFPPPASLQSSKRGQSRIPCTHSCPGEKSAVQASSFPTLVPSEHRRPLPIPLPRGNAPWAHRGRHMPLPLGTTMCRQPQPSMPLLLPHAEPLRRSPRARIPAPRPCGRFHRFQVWGFQGQPSVTPVNESVVFFRHFRQRRNPSFPGLTAYGRPLAKRYIP